MLKRAISFAEEAHQGQKRATGEPYFIRPLTVCEILIDYRADIISLVSALLHDVVGDTNTSLSDMERNFGPQVSLIVDGLTKITRGNLQKDEYNAINFEKLLTASEQDIRVAIIKIADRLHNMRTLAVKKVEKKVPYANETLILFSPLAEKLGLLKIQDELEDLGFSYLNPPKYKKMKKLINSYTNVFIKLFHECNENLESNGYSFVAKVDWDRMPLYKAYSLLQEGHSLSDLFSVKIVTDSTINCYSILGILHNLFKPIKGQFEDNIAIEKSNFSRYLKTKVIINGMEVKVTIQTESDRASNEKGIFSLLKEDLSQEEIRNVSSTLLRNSINAVKSISNNPIEFYDLASFELFQREIAVFTPKMDIFLLSEGSTALDFAFILNPSLAKRMSLAKVNGKYKPINTALKDMDIVEVITANREMLNSNWLNYAYTSKAINEALFN
ncbi:HD domain-containing protein [Thermaerobacillus caldiproteolyticus]|uniref:GTP pyrophosphokinase n=1 Tax=Thermaerobacillus caldiproteolyticus TaxID=247480 RepID=A0A7V9Z9P9_9BACL|nr:HD domain-containing protein [Anoxybacillus caldiproteolyticus]MBA2876583.1 GTP pyrophosphokinase [Anoxybacillus caldiproteolyticus]